MNKPEIKIQKKMDIGVDGYNKAVRLKGMVAHVNRLGIGIKYREIITIKK